MGRLERIINHFRKPVAPVESTESPKATPWELYQKIGESLSDYEIFDHEGKDFLVVSGNKKIGRRADGSTVMDGKIVPIFSHYFEVALDLTGNNRKVIEVTTANTAILYSVRDNKEVSRGTPNANVIAKWLAEVPHRVKWPIQSTRPVAPKE